MKRSKPNPTGKRRKKPKREGSHRARSEHRLVPTKQTRRVQKASHPGTCRHLASRLSTRPNPQRKRASLVMRTKSDFPVPTPRIPPTKKPPLPLPHSHSRSQSHAHSFTPSYPPQNHSQSRSQSKRTPLRSSPKTTRSQKLEEARTHLITSALPTASPSLLPVRCPMKTASTPSWAHRCWSVER